GRTDGQGRRLRHTGLWRGDREAGGRRLLRRHGPGAGDRGGAVARAGHRVRERARPALPVRAASHRRARDLTERASSPARPTSASSRAPILTSATDPRYEPRASEPVAFAYLDSHTATFSITSFTVMRGMRSRRFSMVMPYSSPGSP